MSFVTADFETYYDDKVGFNELTTEEYINHPKFHAIGLGLKVDDEPTVWVTGEQAIREALASIDWSTSSLLGHNLLFDGAILAWRYGIVPAFYFDTLCMARALHGVDAGGSLKALAERYQIGTKGTEVVAAKGKRLQDFSPEELARYGEYCINDVELTYALFQKLFPFPENELCLIDMTLRMFTQPAFILDDALLNARLTQIQQDKSTLLRGLMDILDVGNEEEVRSRLASGPKFAALLEDMGVEPPMKTSPRTGKPTYAFAKNDVGFMELWEHPNPDIQQLCAVRLGTKSTSEASRIARFIDIGARNKGRLPIPVKYYGAHTGRWAGLDAINLQNLPSRDPDKRALKNALRAPDDHIVIDCDSSQIEARILAWLAGQQNVVEAFQQKRDIYCEDATKVFKRPITKADKLERFVGKTMRLGLGFGTGAAKLQHTLKTTPPGADYSLETCEGFVDVWRSDNDKICELWRKAEQGVRAMMGRAKKPYSLGAVKDVVRVESKGFRLPNGLYISYPNLRSENFELWYDARKGAVKLWGGSITENIVQALARIVVGEQMLVINARYPVRLMVHDAVAIIVPAHEKDEAIEYVTTIMATPPSWAAGLPVACEAKWGESYGECR